MRCYKSSSHTFTTPFKKVLSLKCKLIKNRKYRLPENSVCSCDTVSMPYVLIQYANEIPTSEPLGFVGLEGLEPTTSRL